MTIDDQDHYDRALLASRFVECDAAEMAALLVRDSEPGWATGAVQSLRRARKRFATLAAQCELAACAIDEAIG